MARSVGRSIGRVSTNGQRAAPHTACRVGALLTGMLLVGLSIGRWGMPAVRAWRSARGRRERATAHGAGRAALGGRAADPWSEAIRADLALAERNDRYAG